MSWTVFTTVGFLLASVGLGNLALLLSPPRFGSAEWEFAAASQVAASMPVVSLGMTLVVAGAVARGGRGAALAAGLVSTLLALGLVVMAILFALSGPVVLKAVGNPALATSLKKAMVKGGIELLGYFAVNVVLASMALRYRFRNP